MSGTKRQYAIYAEASTYAGPQEVIVEHSGKYDIAGLIVQKDGTWAAVKFGTSWASVKKRTETYFRKTRRAGTYYMPQLTQVASLWEVTAPVVREYFGSHRVIIAKAWHPERGWVDLRTEPGVGRKAGKHHIRALAKEGYTALAFAQRQREADFEMTELLASMNKRTSR